MGGAIFLKKVAKKFALENFLLKNDIFFAKKFAKYNLFIVSLQRRSKEDRARKRDVRDGREMVAMKQRIQSVTTQRKEKYDSRSNYTHRYAERTA